MEKERNKEKVEKERVDKERNEKIEKMTYKNKKG